MKNTLCAAFLNILCSVAFAQNPPTLRATITNHDLDPNKILTQAQVTDDLNYLSFAMTHAYSGYHFVPESGSKVVLSDITNWKIPASLSAKDLIGFLYSEAGKVQDGHFLVQSPFAVGGQTYYFLQRPVSRTGVGVGKNFGPQKKPVWEFNWYDAAHSVPVLSIHAFQPPGGDWDGFTDTVNTLMSSAPYIIIDLRANGGGDDSEGKSLAQMLLDGGTFPTPFKSSSMMQNPFSLEIFLNGIDWFEATWPGGDKSGMELMRQQTESKLAQAIAGTLPSIEVQDFSNQNPSPGPKAYKGKIFILIDRGTDSSGETTAEILGTLPTAKIGGENSAGGISFGTLGILELPNSKIQVGMGINYLAYRDGSVKEIAGITPSIQVPDGTDAIDYLVKSGLLKQ